ncbi:MAG: sensor histidine kinase [Conexibacter sp.]|nr:sensor histidine kinase [Conexibacter sp.]
MPTIGDGDTLDVGTEEHRAHQLALLVESVHDYAIFLVDPEGTIVTWNPGAEHLKGYTADEAIGSHFSMFYTDEDRAIGHPAAELEVAARTGRYEEEGWRIRKDGSRFWANIVLTAVRDPAGGLRGFAKVTRDLTARRAAEAALRQANERLARTNRELDRFAAVAAHDLQEPLRTVAGFAQLLQERHAVQLDERGQTYLGYVSAAVERMQRLVDDLLGYAKAAGEAPAAGTVDLVGCAAVVVAELQAAIGERGAKVVVEVHDGAAVRAHPRDVESVLRNLVSNAVKFADAQDPRVVVRSTPVQEDIRIDIIDNGIGVDPAERPRLFRPFQRLHSASDYPGTGLGLAIAQRVVERSGGSIGVDSVAGEGSRFWFTLPAA